MQWTGTSSQSDSPRLSSTIFVFASENDATDFCDVHERMTVFIERSCESERRDLDIFFWIILEYLPKYCFLSYPVSHILIYSKSNGLLIKQYHQIICLFMLFIEYCSLYFLFRQCNVSRIQEEKYYINAVSKRWFSFLNSKKQFTASSLLLYSNFFVFLGFSPYFRRT